MIIFKRATEHFIYHTTAGNRFNRRNILAKGIKKKMLENFTFTEQKFRSFSKILTMNMIVCLLNPVNESLLYIEIV